MPSRRTTFSDWVTSTGNALGYTTSASLARALGIQQSTVSRWKKGTQPSVAQLAKIGELFGVELKMLLVLAGYLEAAPPTSEELRPTALRTYAEEMISQAGFDSHVEGIVRTYWASRMEEENARLARVIDLTRTALAEGLDQKTVKEERRAQAASDAVNHFSDLARGLMEHLLYEGTLADFEGGERIEGTHWFSAPGRADNPVPPGAATHLVYCGAPGETVGLKHSQWRAVVVDADGEVAFWTEPMSFSKIPEATGNPLIY